MNSNKRKFDHLSNNLERILSEKSIFNYESGQRAFLSLGKGNIYEWLDKLLPNTRLILEPRIMGSIIAIQYINGELIKAINANSEDITYEVKSLGNVPQSVPIKSRIEIQGVLYDEDNKIDEIKNMEFLKIQHSQNIWKGHKFCAFQIFHCQINHFQALQELKNLNFEIPPTQFTNFISDIGIYLKCWQEGKLFTNYPTRGIVLKVNSKKLQTQLGENDMVINWAYSIN